MLRLSNTITNHCLQFSSQKEFAVQTNCNFKANYSAKFTAARRARRVRLTFESLIA